MRMSQHEDRDDTCRIADRLADKTLQILPVEEIHEFELDTILDMLQFPNPILPRLLMAGLTPWTGIRAATLQAVDQMTR